MIDITLIDEPVNLKEYKVENVNGPTLFLGFVIKNEYDNIRLSISEKYNPKKISLPYLKDKQVSSLYQHPKVKGLISLTHGEGFGLPLLEAAACGLPVLATNWSAHTEFLNLGKWTKVESSLLPVPPPKLDNTIWVTGASWAEPKLNSSKEMLRMFVDEFPRLTEEAKPLQKKILTTHSFDKISYRYDKFFKRWK